MAPHQRSRRVHTWRNTHTMRDAQKDTRDGTKLGTNQTWDKTNTKNTIQQKTQTIQKDRKFKKTQKKRSCLLTQTESHWEGTSAREALMPAPRMIAQYMEVVGSDGAHVGVV